MVFKSETLLDRYKDRTAKFSTKELVFGKEGCSGSRYVGVARGGEVEVKEDAIKNRHTD